LWHPAADPATYTRALELEPKYFDVAGQRRVRDGKQLDDIANQTYWIHEFDLSDTPQDVEDFLLETARSLLPRRDTLLAVRNTGGGSELFVGFFPEAFNCGFELSAELQGVCADLGLSLSFDVYGLQADEA
jgi:hypothetical protein